MQLDAHTAVIAPEKVRDYLLSPVHVTGRYKAAFFGSLGYVQDQWQALEKDLRGILAGEVCQSDITEYGQKLMVRGRLCGPNGRFADVVSVWIILSGESSARFVTAYPED